MSTPDPIQEGRQLIAQSMAGPLSPEEYARMDTLLAAYPSLRDEQRLQFEMEVILATAAARQHTPVAGDEIPDKILTALRAARTPAEEKIIPFPAAKSRPAWRWLAAAAALAILAGVWWRTLNPGATVIVHRPDDSFTAPLLTWENGPDASRKFDVWILPAGADQAKTPPLFTGEDLRSPVAFNSLKPAPEAGGKSALDPGGKYGLLICLANTDRMTGTMVHFSVAADAQPLPDSPAAAFLRLQEFIKDNDGAGARRLLQNLPPDWRALPEIEALAVSLPRVGRQ